MKTKIITHRGLDPSRSNYFAESSLQAFTDQLNRGFGLEFDVQFTADGQMIVVHDANLKRITKGADTRAISDINAEEILALDFDGCKLTTIPWLLELIQSFRNSDMLSALHLKHLWQNNTNSLDQIADALDKIAQDSSLILFDAKPSAARYLKSKIPSLRVAASVAHPHDIARYNDAVGGTLLSMDELLAHKDLYSWTWLDEWDLTDAGGGTKTLYNAETFAKLRENGIKIALVTPELHGTSPGLLGGEAHPDAKPFEELASRLRKIIALRPDAICTDYPDYCRNLVNEIQGSTRE